MALPIRTRVYPLQSVSPKGKLSQQEQNDLCSFPRRVIQYCSNPSQCPSVMLIVLWRPTRPSRINVPKRCLFHHKGLECKNMKSRDTWSKRQIWPWDKKWSRPKPNRVLPREHTGHSKHPLPTSQEKTLHKDLTRGSILKSVWLYSLQPKMEKLYTVSKKKKRPGDDCGWDHELLIVKFRLNLKEVGKTTKSFRYDVNQIPYNYTVEVTNRFKELYLIDSAWRTMDGGWWCCIGGSNQDHPQEKRNGKS